MFFYNHDGSKNSPYNLRHTIKKDMFFFLDKLNLFQSGSGRVFRPSSLSPIGYVPVFGAMPRKREDIGNEMGAACSLLCNPVHTKNLFIPSENIKKPNFVRCFQQVQKKLVAHNWLKEEQLSISRKRCHGFLGDSLTCGTYVKVKLGAFVLPLRAFRG